MFKAILFDLDGTLVDSLGYYLKAHQKTLESYGARLTPPEIVSNCFGVEEQVIADKFGLTIEQFRSSYHENIRSFIPHVKLFPNALQTLSLAKGKGIKLAIMSFAYSWYVNEILELLDIKSYFQSILGFNDVKKAKPDPEIIIKTCETLGLKPEDSLAIGDAKSDVLMGKAANTKTALFVPPGNRVFYNFEDLKKSNPDYILENLEQLQVII